MRWHSDRPIHADPRGHSGEKCSARAICWGVPSRVGHPPQSSSGRPHVQQATGITSPLPRGSVPPTKDRGRPISIFERRIWREAEPATAPLKTHFFSQFQSGYRTAHPALRRCRKRRALRIRSREGPIAQTHRKRRDLRVHKAHCNLDPVRMQTIRPTKGDPG